MVDQFKRRLATLDGATLTPLVRCVLNDETVAVLKWGYQRLEGGLSGAYGLYRFQGQAQAGNERLAWSLILKVIGPAGGGPEPGDQDYWKRELLVYQSGLLDDLPGDLVAPRWVAVVEHPDQECWLWLEDVAHHDPEVWPLERYGLAARHLGQFNGAYLAGKPIPAEPWVSGGRFRERLAMAEPGVAELPRLSQLPLFAGLLPADSLDRCLRLWANRRRLLALLDRLPRSLCHHDAFRRNLMSRPDRHGRVQTVAIDWAELGPGTIGAELVSLLAGSLRFVPFAIDQIADLDGLIFAGYIDGLGDAGWQGDGRLARFGYAATAALNSIADMAIKWPRVARRVAALPAGAELPRLLDAGGPAQAAAAQLHLLSLGEDAWALSDSLGL